MAIAGGVVSQGGLHQRKKRCSTPHGPAAREREYYTTNRHAESGWAEHFGGPIDPMELAEAQPVMGEHLKLFEPQRTAWRPRAAVCAYTQRRSSI